MSCISIFTKSNSSLRPYPPHLEAYGGEKGWNEKRWTGGAKYLSPTATLLIYFKDDGQKQLSMKHGAKVVLVAEQTTISMTSPHQANTQWYSDYFSF